MDVKARTLAVLFSLVMAPTLRAVEPGVTVVPFATGAPELPCETLRVCAVELETGERVVKTYLGDAERWKVDVQLSEEGGVKPLVVLKPTECGIETNLIVSTDRRIYDVLVRSRSCASPGDGLKLGPRRLRFDYGGFSQDWNDRGQPGGPAGEPGAARPQSLNFRYSWAGGWRGIQPKLVYDDGKRVYVRLEKVPEKAPAIFRKGAEGLELVPFRLEGSVYVIEAVPEELVLVSGPHEKRDRTIVRRVGE
ncbi:MAG: TrbG/VirB9 family P-type conjugative transfer protein [Thermoanaerobaculia bacterium]